MILERSVLDSAKTFSESDEDPKIGKITGLNFGEEGFGSRIFERDRS
jgi:hypothetical protein